MRCASIPGALGASDAAHATATGKAMLAWLPEHEIRRVLAVQGMTRFTPNTITDAGAFIKELQLVRRHGHAVDREEFQPGVVCIGAAIRNHLGAVVGAISASAPTLRATDEHLARVRDGVMAAARALSAEFGERSGEPADTAAAPVNQEEHDVRTARRKDQQGLPSPRHHEGLGAG